MNKIVVGIDPSMRNTGICILEQKKGVHGFIKLRGMGVYEGKGSLADCIMNWRLWWWPNIVSYVLSEDQEVVFVVERQFHNAVSSGYTFPMMMEVISDIKIDCEGCKIMAPLPVQLKSYARRMGVLGLGKKPIMERATAELEKITAGGDWDVAEALNDLRPKRGKKKQLKVTSHEADAYILCRMALEIEDGGWELKIPKDQGLLF